MPKTAKLFRNGRSQAVRLPREFRFPGDEVLIERRGFEIVLRPKAVDWKEFFEGPNPVPKDFLTKRKDWKLKRRKIF